MKKIFFLVLMLWAGVLSAQLSAYNYTTISRRFFTDSEYNTLIRSAALSAARESGVPKRIFDERYPAYQKNIENLARPEIVKAFKWVEFTGESSNRAAEGSKAFKKQKELYSKQLRKAVVRAIDGSDVFEELLRFDFSDRILLFKSVVNVRVDGKLDVIEEITIYNGEGKQNRAYRGEKQDNINNEIQRGIRREFPTRYTAPNGFLSFVPFELISVERDGEPEAFTKGDKTNGVYYLIGRSDVFLSEGIHTYRLRYQTARQMVYAAGYDELYWNGTGNGWSFDIDSAVCEIHFPGGSKIIQQACYTGPQGENTKLCGSEIVNDSVITFFTTQPLGPFEGLTVGAAIARGVMIQPATAGLILNFLHDNIILPAMVGLLLLILTLNYFFWRKVGRDPKQGAIYPQFEPPPRLSPAEVGYIIEQDFKPHLAAASLVDAAVNRHITIDVGKEGMVFKQQVYIIEKLPSSRAKKTSYHSFGDESSLSDIGKIVKGSYNSSLNSFGRSVRRYLEEKYLIDPVGEKRKHGLFAHNIGKSGVGYAFLVIAGIGIVLSMAIFENYTPMLLVSVGVLFAVSLTVQIVFSRIMGAYTVEGRKLADQILGFKMYLEAAEKHVFDKLMPPEKTLELFEKYLPFAIALKVENQWAAQFEEVLQRAIENNTYNPAWYSGSMSNFSHSSSFASSFASGLSNTVSSASSPPSSSSGGSSGGGSSGGGGW
jgi:uncharacterized membrane protein YgcG